MTRPRGSRGVTLIEMLIAVTLVSLAASLSYPSLISGLDAIRLASAANSTAGFLTAAIQRVERRQTVIEVAILPRERVIQMTSTEAGFRRELKLTGGVTIREVHPRLPAESSESRRFLLLPGGAPPRIGVELVNARGARRMVRIDPIAGAALVETPAEARPEQEQ